MHLARCVHKNMNIQNYSITQIFYTNILGRLIMGHRVYIPVYFVVVHVYFWHNFSEGATAAAGCQEVLQEGEGGGVSPNSFCNFFLSKKLPRRGHCPQKDTKRPHLFGPCETPPCEVSHNYLVIEFIPIANG